MLRRSYNHCKAQCPTVMKLSHGKCTQMITLIKNSLLSMTDEVRYEWTHAIDKENTSHGQTRYSDTSRHMKNSPQIKTYSNKAKKKNNSRTIFIGDEDVIFFEKNSWVNATFCGWANGQCIVEIKKIMTQTKKGKSSILKESYYKAIK